MSHYQKKFRTKTKCYGIPTYGVIVGLRCRPACEGSEVPQVQSIVQVRVNALQGRDVAIGLIHSIAIGTRHVTSKI